MDFGKLDFVMNQGEVVLLDVNRTPGFSGDPQRAAAAQKALAGGIEAFAR